MVPPTVQPNPAEQFCSTGGGGSISAELQWYLNVFLSGQGRDQLEGLKDESDLLTADPGSRILVQRPELLTIEVDRTGRGLVQPGKQAKERGLSTAGGPQDGKEATRLETEADILQHSDFAAPGAVLSSESSAAQHRIRHLE